MQGVEGRGKLTHGGCHHNLSSFTAAAQHESTALRPPPHWLDMGRGMEGGGELAHGRCHPLVPKINASVIVNINSKD